MSRIVDFFKAVSSDPKVRVAFQALFWAVVGAAVSYFGLQRPQPPQQQAPLIDSLEPVIGSQGWIEDPKEVDRIVAETKVHAFLETPAGKALDSELPRSVYLWKAYEKIGLSRPAIKNQGSVGSCVAFGTATAIERTIANSIALGKREHFKYLCEEAIYGGSRYEIGGGRIRGDGSIGAWAAKWVNRYGILPRDKIRSYDLRQYDEARCRDWGRNGVPDDLEPDAKEHPVKDIALVGSWSEAKKALASGYGIAVCSNQGFSMTRDSRGVARPQGQWAHCMCLDGYHVEPDGSEFGHITNSWGASAHRGPVGWGDPNPDGFWAEAKVIDRMLRQGDSWAFSDVVGFPRKIVDWPAMREVRPRIGFDLVASFRGN
ncbi:MAG: hypothetical protein KatS3mg105_5032 [Gemmatales bacterium]|nr:MAG: hypothetical protein KatS3mg105_5032 [Gemmatales bacterium]